MMNQDMRDSIRRNRLFAGDVAVQLGCSRQTVFNWLAAPLTPERREKLLKAISEAAKRREQEMLQ